jgi:ATP-dependent DNA ligase
MLAVKEDGVVRLISRNGRDHTKRFVDLVVALTKPSDAAPMPWRV